ncbi:MAG: hypothetical protein J5662_06270 [Clostridia bacterium]|nr:hypothetical protein [Clostridia bacterium]
MKKLLLPILSLIFFFVACADTARYTTLNFHSVAFTADITYGNERVCAECSVDNNRNFTATIISPENLRGISIITGNSGMSLIFDNMEIKYIPLFSGESPIELLKEIISLTDGRRFSCTGNNGLLTGTLGDNEYKLTAAPTGLPITFEIAKLNLKILFKDITVI